MLDWIDPTFRGADIALTALVLLLLAANILRATPAQLERVRTRVAATPDGRIRHYRTGILASWVLAGLSLEPTLFDSGVTLTDLGLGGINTLQIAVAACIFVLGTALRIVRVKVAMVRRRDGRTVPGGEVRRRVAFLIPRTRRERWWAAGLAVTAGVTEEIVFRGLLIAAGVGILGLPVWAAALLSAVLFGISHRYQGVPGMIGTGIVGVLMTALYALTGNLLAAMALHAAVDVVALLATPQELFEASTPAPVSTPVSGPIEPPSPLPAAAALTPPSPAGSLKLRAAAPE